MIEIVFAFMNAMDNIKQHTKKQNKRQEQERCGSHPLRELLEETKGIVDDIEQEKKKLDFHQAHFKAMYKLLSDIMASEGKPEGSPEQTQSEAKPEPKDKTAEQTKKPDSPMEGSRLKQLEQGLYNAIGVLSGTKMASHFKTIKQLLADLTALADADEMPEVERVADLKSCLQNAVDVLGNEHCSSRAKVTQELRNELIELLGSSTQ